MQPSRQELYLHGGPIGTVFPGQKTVPGPRFKEDEYLEIGNSKVAHVIQPFWSTKGREKKGSKSNQNGNRERPDTDITISNWIRDK